MFFVEPETVKSVAARKKRAVDVPAKAKERIPRQRVESESPPKAKKKVKTNPSTKGKRSKKLNNEDTDQHD